MEYNTSLLKIIVRPDDIIEIILHDKTKMMKTREDALETVTMLRQAIDGKIRATLTELPSLYMSKEVMKTLEEEKAGECAAAMVASSFGAKVLGNFFIKILGKSGEMPVKLFTNREKAEKWLLERIAETKSNA